MNEIAIKLDGISKSYRIGKPEDSTGPAKGFWSRLRSAYGGSKNDNSELFWAIKDLSFEITKGQIVGILGRNGAGKSTLLKILSRITAPTDGTAIINGRTGTLLEVGTGFHPELTGKENVFLNASILGMSSREMKGRFDAIVEFSGIQKFLNTPVKRYSSGMYVRLAFAVAAHLEPEVLLVDEVLAVGDAAFQNKCLGKMDELARSGRTVLFVSHNVSAVMRLCTHGIYLKDGALEFQGKIADAVAAYMGVSNGLVCQREWDEAKAPGNDSFRLLKVELLDPQDETQGPTIDIEQAFKIRIHYSVNQPDLRFRCLISLHADGACAFPALEPEELVRSQTGKYWSEVTIPGNLLAEGQYSLTVSIFSSKGVKTHLAREEDVLIFTMSDGLSGNSARGDYAAGLTGVVRPKLPWTLRYADEVCSL